MALGQNYVAPVVLFGNSWCSATTRLGRKVTRRVNPRSPWISSNHHQGARRGVGRGFLFGLGSFLVIAAIGSASSFLIGSFGRVGLVLGLGCIPLSIIVIRAAISAPSHQSRLHAFVGWCLGFFVIDAAIFAAVAIAILIPGTA
jgi:hypothetical protein